MRRRLYLIAVINAILFVLGGAVIFRGITGITENISVHDLKNDTLSRFLQALNHLQRAQTQLFRNQAGYDPDINTLILSIEEFEREVDLLTRRYQETRWPASCTVCHADDLELMLGTMRENLAEIKRLSVEYKQRVSIMLTSTDVIHRRKLEVQSSEYGADIIRAVEETNNRIARMVTMTVAMNKTAVGRALSLIVIVVLLVVLGIMATLAVIIPSISRSMGELVAGTEAIATGHYEKRLPVKSMDDLGILAERFNRMADNLGTREKELRDLNANLERLVRERTALLEKSNAELRLTATSLEKANQELKELDRLKSNFIAVASHELRTPLVTVYGYIEMLMEGKVAEPLNLRQRELLAGASRSSRRLIAIVKNILDASRIELKKLASALQPVHLEKVLREAVADQRHFAEMRSQKLLLNLPADPGLPTMEGDEGLLLQVFVNLLNNAIKYTPNGGIIAVEMRQVTREEVASQAPGFPVGDRFLQVQVTDSGIGIPGADLARVFDRFYEVGDAMSHSSSEYKFMGGGIGLGLSIVKGFVEEHGGVIWVESRGRDVVKCPGSRFTILFPVLRREERVVTSHLGGDKVFGSEPEAHGNQEPVTGVILVIDDDPDILRFMEILLSERYTVHCAGSGLAGLEKSRELRPDLVLVDLLMHDLDGREVTRTLKGDERTSGIPVILFSARSERSEIEDSLSSGADGYIGKPFTHDELFDLLDTHLRRRRSRDKAPPPA
jgi:signal transduction histidine kinase/CheY-like chemotaxis protein